jgi:hypothetical protein
MNLVSFLLKDDYTFFITPVININKNFNRHMIFLVTVYFSRKATKLSLLHLAIMPILLYEGDLR